jgi:hypothetical protein
MASAETNFGEEEVAVKVAISPQQVPGALTLTVDDDTVTLGEDLDPDEAGVREFDGTLPLVTVQDTRTTIPAGAFWTVFGWAGDFTKDDDNTVTIPASQLGWDPKLVDAGDTSDPYDVYQGPYVGTSLDANPDKGLAWDSSDPDYAGELLAMVDDSGALVGAGETAWTARAELFLRTPTTVTAGSYTATLTLALFE